MILARREVTTLATKTSWGILNYTRSKDVQERQARNLNASLRAAKKQVAFQRAYDSLTNLPTQEGEAYEKAMKRTIAAKSRFVTAFDAIPNRDSAMY